MLPSPLHLRPQRAPPRLSDLGMGLRVPMGLLTLATTKPLLRLGPPPLKNLLTRPQVASTMRPAFPTLGRCNTQSRLNS